VFGLTRERFAAGRASGARRITGARTALRSMRALKNAYGSDPARA